MRHLGTHGVFTSLFMNFPIITVYLFYMFGNFRNDILNRFLNIFLKRMNHRNLLITLRVQETWFICKSKLDHDSYLFEK
jgi:hypothetical protein